jgi:hypothetical protein
MSRPDYDVGDLIVAIRDGRQSPIRRGQVFRCLRLDRAEHVRTGEGTWGVAIDGPMPNTANLWNAACFRRIDPKPPAFWTGEIEAECKEPAEA